MIWNAIIGIFISCMPVDQAFRYFDIAKVDTMSLNNYYGISYYRQIVGKDTIRFGLFIEKDSSSVLKMTDFEMNIYNFCQNDSTNLRPCYLRDINHDNFPEILTTCYTGGNACCQDLYVYSLAERIILLDTIHTETAFGDLKDIDADSIPEYVWSDLTFDFWRTFYTAWENSTFVRLPILIWKWDGNRFRIANFRLSKSIWDSLEVANQLYVKIPEPADSDKIGYDSSVKYPAFPPPELVSDMLTDIYKGKFLESDSLLNYYWPSNIPGKGDFIRDFKKQLESGDYWQQLLESNWK